MCGVLISQSCHVLRDIDDTAQFLLGITHLGIDHFFRFKIDHDGFLGFTFTNEARIGQQRMPLEISLNVMGKHAIFKGVNESERGASFFRFEISAIRQYIFGRGIFAVDLILQLLDKHDGIFFRRALLDQILIGAPEDMWRIEISPRLLIENSVSEGNHVSRCGSFGCKKNERQRL